MSLKVGNVTKIDLVDHVTDTLDFCRVLVELDEYYIFYNFGELQKFVSKDVQFTTRDDVWQGTVYQVINDPAMVHVVQTANTTIGESLIPVNVLKGVYHFEIGNLRPGDVAIQEKVLLCEVELVKGANSTYYQMVCLDSVGVRFNLRLFVGGGELEQQSILESLIGTYITTNISNGRYGYQTDEVRPCFDPVIAPPEVAVAKAQLVSILASDPELNVAVSTHSLVDKLEVMLHGEMGYHLVEMAIECQLIRTVSNCSKIYDTRALYRSVFMSRLHYLTKRKRSAMFASSSLTMSSAVKDDDTLLNILDVTNINSECPERELYIQVRKLKDTIVGRRRENGETEAYRKLIADFNVSVGGLFG